MERSVTNAVQWAIAALSVALLAAAAHARTSSTTPAEGLTAMSLTEHTPQPAVGPPHRIRVGVAPMAAHECTAASANSQRRVPAGLVGQPAKRSGRGDATGWLSAGAG